MEKQGKKSLDFQGESAVGRKRTVISPRGNVDNVENFSMHESFTFPFFEYLSIHFSAVSIFFDSYISAFVFRVFYSL